MAGKRLYAHVHRLTAACPGCGRLAGQTGPKARQKVYDASTGLWRCPCGYVAYVGVIFWPRARQGSVRLPPDHVLTPGEAAALRLELSYAETPAATQRNRQAPQLGAGLKTGPVNRECTCGGCEVHPGGVKTP